MCGQFALKAPSAKLVWPFGLDACAHFKPRYDKPRYDIPPGTDIPVIRQSPEGKRVWHLLRWGLVPNQTFVTVIKAACAVAIAAGVYVVTDSSNPQGRSHSNHQVGR